MPRSIKVYKKSGHIGNLLFPEKSLLVEGFLENVNEKNRPGSRDTGSTLFF
jgi:hypothetical protein